MIIFLDQDTVKLTTDGDSVISVLASTIITDEHNVRLDRMYRLNTYIIIYRNDVIYLNVSYIST